MARWMSVATRDRRSIWTCCRLVALRPTQCWSLLPGDVTSANLALGRLGSALTDFVILNLLPTSAFATTKVNSELIQCPGLILIQAGNSLSLHVSIRHKLLRYAQFPTHISFVTLKSFNLAAADSQVSKKHH